MNKTITLLVLLFLFAGTSFAQTTVSGQILSNTTWTKAGSPYTCSGLIEIDSNATLTIEPGTIIELDKNLDVYGHIVFQNNSTDMTVIRSANSPYIRILNSNYSDTIVLKHYQFSSVGFGIDKRKTTLTIEECSFNEADVNWRPSGNRAFTFENNKCTESTVYISNDWHSDLAENIFINNNSFENINRMAIEGSISTKNPAQITNSTFSGRGIHLDASGGIFVSGNIFYRTGTGLIFWPQSGIVKIVSNIFAENDVAIDLTGIGNTLEIRDNAIYKNNVGVAVYYDYKANYPPSGPINPPVIENNCIYDNKICGFGWGGDNDITLGANWWGTTDTNKIDSMILDDKDDFKKGLVTYTPILTLSNPGCKTYTPPTKIEGLPVNRNVIQTYPNPFSNTIEFRSGISIKSISLYNMLGKLLYQSEQNSKNMSVNTAEYPAGVYIYRITTDDNNLYNGKLIKQ